MWGVRTKCDPQESRCSPTTTARSLDIRVCARARAEHTIRTVPADTRPTLTACNRSAPFPASAGCTVSRSTLGPTVTMQELAYAQHSGFGVQMQSLTTAVFLANITNSRLIVPPWLTRDQMNNAVWDNRLGRRCKTSDFEAGPNGLVTAKVKFNKDCEKAISRACEQSHVELDRFELVFDLESVAATRPRRCDTDTSICSRMSADAHLGTLATNSNCTRGFSCGRLFAMLAGASELASPMCLGPLNDWWFTANDPTILDRCAKQHALAAILSAQGLPLRTGVLELVTAQLVRGSVAIATGPEADDDSIADDSIAGEPARPDHACDLCIYARLPDGDHRPSSLASMFAAANHSTSRLAAAFRAFVAVNGVANGAPSDTAAEVMQEEQVVSVEVVSSCAPEEVCHAALAQTDLTGAVTGAVTGGAVSGVSSSTARKGLKMQWQLRSLPAHQSNQTDQNHGQSSSHSWSQLAHALKLSAENARIVVDQIRCARCRHLVALSHRSGTSSFWGQINKLHRRLQGRNSSI